MNAYQVLGIPVTADREQIRAAYRALARRWHPDRFMAGPERDWANDKMAEINAAYRECLDGLTRVQARGGRKRRAFEGPAADRQRQLPLRAQAPDGYFHALRGMELPVRRGAASAGGNGKGADLPVRGRASESGMPQIHSRTERGPRQPRRCHAPFCTICAPGIKH